MYEFDGFPKALDVVITRGFNVYANEGPKESGQELVRQNFFPLVVVDYPEDGIKMWGMMAVLPLDGEECLHMVHWESEGNATAVPLQSRSGKAIAPHRLPSFSRISASEDLPAGFPAPSPVLKSRKVFAEEARRFKQRWDGEPRLWEGRTEEILQLDLLNDAYPEIKGLPTFYGCRYAKEPALPGFRKRPIWWMACGFEEQWWSVFYGEHRPSKTIDLSEMMFATLWQIADEGVSRGSTDTKKPTLRKWNAFSGAGQDSSLRPATRARVKHPKQEVSPEPSETELKLPAEDLSSEPLERPAIKSALELAPGERPPEPLELQALWELRGRLKAQEVIITRSFNVYANDVPKESGPGLIRQNVFPLVVVEYPEDRLKMWGMLCILPSDSDEECLHVIHWEDDGGATAVPLQTKKGDTIAPANLPVFSQISASEDLPRGFLAARIVLESTKLPNEDKRSFTQSWFDNGPDKEPVIWKGRTEEILQLNLLNEAYPDIQGLPTFYGCQFPKEPLLPGVKKRPTWWMVFGFEEEWSVSYNDLLLSRPIDYDLSGMAYAIITQVMNGL